VRVVYLTNFLSPDIVEICREFSHRVGELILLVSVPMEGNRSWQANDSGLDVRVQKTWTLTRTDRHPSGYEDVNYVHVPLDTYGQLRRLQPDVIVSAELGARSLMSATYRRFHSACRHIVAVNTSEHIEASRKGKMRRMHRRRLLRVADAVTHNGPSAREFLLGLGAKQDHLFEWMYAADPQKIYRGEIRAADVPSPELKLLTIGQLIERKGLVEALDGLQRVAGENPSIRIRWTLVGDGPLRDSLLRAPMPDNLQIDCLGNCDADQIQHAYGSHQIMLFPTLGDEWGLVVDEAMSSGLSVIGSQFSQAVTTLVKNDFNGWIFDPRDSSSLTEAIQSWLHMSTIERLEFRKNARRSMVDRTPAVAADQICEVIHRVTDA